jgi:hypothetical protein
MKPHLPAAALPNTQPAPPQAVEEVNVAPQDTAQPGPAESYTGSAAMPVLLRATQAVLRCQYCWTGTGGQDLLQDLLPSQTGAHSTLTALGTPRWNDGLKPVKLGKKYTSLRAMYTMIIYQGRAIHAPEMSTMVRHLQAACQSIPTSGCCRCCCCIAIALVCSVAITHRLLCHG